MLVTLIVGQRVAAGASPGFIMILACQFDDALFSVSDMERRLERSLTRLACKKYPVPFP
jgi:hypothetical protein